MIAKLIVHGSDRDDALNRMKRALDEFVLEGIDNNIEFLFEILSHERFAAGDFDTSFLSQEFDF
jgi:acetyl-CoA carboxylase biotin carboxylase subunit